MTPTTVIDRAAQRLPYLYFAVRCGMLLLSFLSFAAWMITGFNVVEGSVALIGIQWSTFCTFCVFFYLMAVNLQVGGLHSLKQLGSEIRYDLHFLGVTVRYPRSVQEFYKEEEVVDGTRAAMMCLLICTGCLFIFEMIWVPLYDYFEYGSLLWPVYQTIATPPPLQRNFLLGIVLTLCGFLVLGAAIDGTGKELYHRFTVSWRVDRYWALILLATVGTWCLWIYFPHQPVATSSLTPSSVLGPMAKTFDSQGCYIFPSQHLFPQNTYTIYLCGLFDKTVSQKDILEFFAPGNALHAVNVLTKAFTFASVCYPAMARVKRNE